MDNNKAVILPAALALGVGLGVGMSTTLQNWTSTSSSFSSSSSAEHNDDTAQLLHIQLISQVIDGHGSSITFDNFPYYLSEQTKMLLKNAACVHLKQLEFSKFTRKLSPASRTILLSGPPGTETYHQMLAKALAHAFDAKLLILDITDLSRKILSKFGTPTESTHLSLVAKNLANGVAQRVLEIFSSDVIGNSLSGLLPAKTRRPKSEGNLGAPLKRELSWPFEDKLLVVAIYKVLRKLSESNPTILYMRDVEKLILRGSNTFSLFQRMVNKLAGPIFILGSRVLDTPTNDQVANLLHDKLGTLFPYKIDIKAPEDTTKLVSWKSRIEEDMKAMRIQDNRNHISEVLAANDVECEDLDSFSFSDSLLSDNLIEEIVVSAISHHLMNTDKPHHRSGRLVISSTSLVHGLSLFQTGQLDTKDAKLQLESNPKTPKESSDCTIKVVAKSSVEAEADMKDANKRDDAKDALKKEGTAAKEIVPDNEFEKRIRPEIIPAGEIGVSFHDIGALDEVKDVLQEVVMLPLQRPELFSKGGLIKPCKGVLLFGPPGTGKTMLAKAVATEAGASFINVSMSTITSKWFGEDEKNVKALFTLAAKVAPTIIFIDEVDSMLGQRSRNGEHEAMRKIKNEFMAHWDGLLSKSGQKVLVLAATNRPFDLDDAIIRRFERRIMVGLPEKNNREKILRAILEKESVADDLDYDELATMTEGYSGSDLKNLCTVAAYRPLKELLKQEKRNDKNVPETARNSENITKVEDRKDDNNTNGGDNMDKKDYDNVYHLRPLNMEDMKQAKRQVSSSFAAEGAGMADLKSWNELFGEGGTRAKQQLTYFL